MYLVMISFHEAVITWEPLIIDERVVCMMCLCVCVCKMCTCVYMNDVRMCVHDLYDMCVCVWQEPVLCWMLIL